MRRMLLFAAFCAVLCLAGTSCAETVIYDGNNIAPFMGRTREDVAEKYREARSYEGTYREGQSTWYTVPASTKSPYNAGVLTQDTINTMWAMMNFYRWLTGAKTITDKPAPSVSLQHQALDRNFHFDHEISQDRKPADMPQDLWDIGFECHHSALAMGFTPKEAVTAWMNEGYSPASQEWADYKYGGGVGHRTSLINPEMVSIQFGYSGSVAINYSEALYSGRTDWVFTAFPPPGFMPEDKILPYNSAWHVDLNVDILYAQENLAVTVTDLTDGASYTCTRDNGKISPYSGQSLVIFAQPFTPDEDGIYSSSYRYSHDYRVRVTGLKETGNDAEIVYTVSFMHLPPEITTRTDIHAVTGNRVYEQLKISSSAPANWTLKNGKLPDGLIINDFTIGDNEYHYLDGTPTTAGTYTFTLEASNEYGSDTAVFLLTAENLKPSFVTEDLKPASVDVEYSEIVRISGSLPAAFTVSNGTLPPGLTLSNDGKITGTPTTAGQYHFTVTASNAGGNEAKSFTITASRVKPKISEYNLVHDTVSVNTDISYEMRIYAQGSKPVTFTLESGRLPDGLTLNPDGTITGKPAATGQYTFTVRAENDLGYDTRSFTVEAANVKPEIYEQTFGTLRTGEACRVEIVAGGSKPLTWTLETGNFPDGLTLSRDKGPNDGAVISGVPARTGTFTFTMRAENSAGYDTRELVLTVEQGNNSGGNSNTGGNGNSSNGGNGNGNTEPKQDNSGGGGCNGLAVPAIIIVPFISKKNPRP